MPPFKAAMPRSIGEEGEAFLRAAGHGRRLVIVDSSYDIPDGVNKFSYMGNPDGVFLAGRVLKDIMEACPVEGPVAFMAQPAAETEEAEADAPVLNERIVKELGLTAIPLVPKGEGGFYESANGIIPNLPPIFCITASEEAYDCIMAHVGHSQT